MIGGAVNGGFDARFFKAGLGAFAMLSRRVPWFALEDGAGMRRALADCAVAVLRADEAEASKLEEEEGYASVAKMPGPFAMYVCPSCRLVWRDLRRQKCRGCDYEFPGPIRQSAD